MNAKEVLLGIRLAKRDPIVREVVVNDPEYHAIYARWKQEIYPHVYTDEYFANLGTVPALEVPAGWSPHSASFRRIDALLFGRSGLTAIEIKVTRPDFFADTEEKRRPWRDVTDFFVYATPPGLVKPEEVPAGCGLWEVELRDRVGMITTVKRAVRNKERRELPDQVTKALIWRLSNRERREELE